MEAYLYGDASARAAGHIARCPACAARVAELRAFSAALQGGLLRADCPPVEELRQRRWDLLPAARSRAIDAHLKTCAACRAEWERFEGPEPGPAQRLLDGLRRGLTVLVAQPLTAGLSPVRDTSDTRGRGARSLMYSVPDRPWSILLIEGANPQGHALSGQIVGPVTGELAGAMAGAISDDRLVTDAAIDDTGWFELQPLPAGAYVVWLDLAGSHVRIPDVRVGPPD